MEEFKRFMEKQRQEIDRQLPALLENLDCPEMLKEAMLYSVHAGGKRVRPLLTLAVIESYRDITNSDYVAACAHELVHTYSLIHDDLPAMDDDDYRRGQLTNHKVYGEAVAILAGDALLTRAFELIGSLQHVTESKKTNLIVELAKASGAEGMVGGQVSDLAGEGKDLQLAELEMIHHHKTGALITYAIISGAIVSDAPEEDIRSLRSFSKHLGLLFQIKDDILDVEGDSETMGKPAGSDEGKMKSTYPRLLTLAGAKEKLIFHAEKARESLHSISGNTELLDSFISYIMNRTH
ncbi:polyprenyl synthetase family protein [Bacillus piscicola]|uniref:polyprenyl synthetase family protein n=1 Tax=Bacillus piscicola TaxID=1632684 RepID=UPI001F0949EA|nr:farnesyl diphosphate synthase [Bacillus piscicola]